MEILIRLAGVQLGPYSEIEVQQHLADGLLSLKDPAQLAGSEDWIALGDILAKGPPATDILPKLVPREGHTTGEEPAVEKEPDHEETPDAPKRAPSTPPGVTRLPTRIQEPERQSSVPSQAKKTAPMGPTTPISFSPVKQSATSTAPLMPASQGTKKMARPSIVKGATQKTAPLPTKAIPIPTRPPSSATPPAIPNAPASPAPAPQAPVSPAPEPKRAPPLPELSAKTVPMRSLPGAIPSRATIPVTEPLPTRQVFKSASGKVPPPSVVSALTKKLGRMTPFSGPPSSPPEPVLGMPLEETKTDVIPAPVKKTAPKPPPVEETPAPAKETPLVEPVEPKAPARITSILIYACAALALLTLYYVWSPYHAASGLRNALSNGDQADLASAIDFPAVGASLKQQIHDRLAQSGFQAGTSNAASSALTMIDHSIDHYVTAEGISGLIKTPDSTATGAQGPTISPTVAANLLLSLISHDQPPKTQGLASLGDFVLDWDVALLHLQFHGLGWKLRRVDLRPDISAQGLSDTAIPLLSPVVDTYLEAGGAKMKTGDWKGAIANFTQVLAIDPQSSVAYNDRGGARQSSNDLAGAIKDYTQALTIDPQMAAAYNGRGNAKAAKNDLDGAIADFTLAVHLDPSMAIAYDSRGNLKTAKDDLDGAIADYTQAITLDPNLASAYSDRGFARQANGNLDGAISDYTQALALKPKTAMAYYNRGLARQAQGNLDAAIVDFDRALAFDPKIAGAYYSRGNAKNANHDLDGAIADYTQAVALDPKRALAYCSRGEARQAKGDLDGAVADYTQALAIDPKIAVAYYNRAFIDEQRDNLDDAIADATQALYLDPKDAQAYNIRGFAKLAKGNLDGALADLTQYCDMAPRDHDADHARLYLWLIAKAQNSRADADQELSDALENSWNSNPDDLISKTAAFLLGRMTEADYLAAASSSDAKTDQAQRCQSWYFTGMKRLLMGDKKGAIDAFHQCLATGQKDFCEYLLAQAELQGLEAPPSPIGPMPANIPVAQPVKNP